MSPLPRLWPRLPTDDSGQGNAEYALLIVVVMAIFGVIMSVSNGSAGTFFQSLWNRLVNSIG